MLLNPTRPNNVQYKATATATRTAINDNTANATSTTTAAGNVEVNKGDFTRKQHLIKLIIWTTHVLYGPGPFTTIYTI